MKCYIAERPVDPGIVGPPAMNYGQHFRWAGKPQLQYRYEMSVLEFVEALNPWIEQCRRELAADAGSDPPGTFPAVEEFERLGFPPLQTMIDSHPEALARLMCWYAMDLNNAFAGMDCAQDRYYSTNSVDWFRVENGVVSFGGVAYENRLDRGQL